MNAGIWPIRVFGTCLTREQAFALAGKPLVFLAVVIVVVLTVVTEDVLVHLEGYCEPHVFQCVLISFV